MKLAPDSRDKKALAQLLQIWEQAIADWHANQSSVRLYDIAESAMSRGSYFEAIYSQDPLLEEIHHNFGILEVAGPEDDPDNAQLWAKQAGLIAQARQLYGQST